MMWCTWPTTNSGISFVEVFEPVVFSVLRSHAVLGAKTLLRSVRTAPREK